CSLPAHEGPVSLVGQAIDRRLVRKGEIADQLLGVRPGEQAAEAVPAGGVGVELAREGRAFGRIDGVAEADRAQRVRFEVLIEMWSNAPGQGPSPEIEREPNRAVDREVLTMMLGCEPDDLAEITCRSGERHAASRRREARCIHS